MNLRIDILVCTIVMELIVLDYCNGLFLSGGGKKGDKKKNTTPQSDGELKWQVKGDYDYHPVEQRIWLGSAPANCVLKYGNQIPGMMYRNLKLFEF